VSIETGATGPQGPPGEEGPPGEGVTPGLEHRLQVLLTSTEGIRKQLRLENQKRDRRIFWSRVLVVIALVVGAGGVFSGLRASNDLHTSNARTTNARIVSCDQYNVQERAQVHAEEAAWRNFGKAFIDADPSARDAILGFLPKQYALIIAAHKSRDCSPAGVAKYLGQASTIH
jgi:hypothetical protein